MTERCPRCDGDGYLEQWNDDQSGVVIEMCPECAVWSACGCDPSESCSECLP